MASPARTTSDPQLAEDPERCPSSSSSSAISSVTTTATYVSHIAPAKAIAEATNKTANLPVQP